MLLNIKKEANSLKTKAFTVRGECFCCLVMLVMRLSVVIFVLIASMMRAVVVCTTMLLVAAGLMLISIDMAVAVIARSTAALHKLIIFLYCFKA